METYPRKYFHVGRLALKEPRKIQICEVHGPYDEYCFPCRRGLTFPELYRFSELQSQGLSKPEAYYKLAEESSDHPFHETYYLHPAIVQLTEEAHRYRVRSWLILLFSVVEFFTIIALLALR